MFALYLNPMTGNSESSTCVAIADTADKLEQFMLNERVEPYTDVGTDFFNFDGGGGTKNYNKVFKKGGMLEMFNAVEGSFGEPTGIVEIPSLDDINSFYQDQLIQDISGWNSRYGQVLQL